MFLVPIYVSCNFSTPTGLPSLAHAQRLLAEAVALVRTEMPYWNCSAGADHVFVTSHDFGACFHPMFQEVQHVVIPPEVARELLEPEKAQPDIFAFFRGKMEVHPKNISGHFYSKKVRTELLQLYGRDRKFYLKR